MISPDSPSFMREAYEALEAQSREIRGLKELVMMFVQQAGGRFELSANTMITFNNKSVLTSWDSPATGSKLFVLEKPKGDIDACEYLR